MAIVIRALLILAGLLAAALAAVEAHAAPGATVFIAGAVGDGPARDAAVEARADEVVTLYAVVRLGRGRRATFHTAAPALRIGRRLVPAKRIRPLAALGVTGIRWSQIETRPRHVELAPPNEDDPTYSNTVLYGEQHGKWLGYDALEYYRTPLATADGAAHLTVERITPTGLWRPRASGLGTMRYQVDLVVDGQRLASPGIEATMATGIAARVMRVSRRGGDDLIGWLESLYYVPYVFGSAGKGSRHQTDLHQGTDCADAIVGALRKGGADIGYTYTTGLMRYAPPVGERLYLDKTGVYRLDEDGARGEPVTLRFGRDVRPGDVVLLDYVGYDGTDRSWDHVGVLAADRGVVGELDPADPLLHMGNIDGLEQEPASAQAPVIIQLLRFKRRHLRRLERR